MAILTLNPIFPEIRGSVKSLTFKRHPKGAVACGRPLMPSGESIGQKRTHEVFIATSKLWALMPPAARYFSRVHGPEISSDRNNFFRFNILEEPVSSPARLLAPVDKSIPKLTNMNLTTGGGAGEVIFTYDPPQNPSNYDLWIWILRAGYFWCSPHPEIADLSTGSTSVICNWVASNQRVAITIIDLDQERARSIYSKTVLSG